MLAVLRQKPPWYCLSVLSDKDMGGSYRRIGPFQQKYILYCFSPGITLLCRPINEQMAMENKDKYTAPETEVLELQTEGVIADSKFDPSSGAGID